jgi:hypothetical protein
LLPHRPPYRSTSRRLPEVRSCCYRQDRTTNGGRGRTHPRVGCCWSCGEEIQCPNISRKAGAQRPCKAVGSSQEAAVQPAVARQDAGRQMPGPASIDACSVTIELLNRAVESSCWLPVGGFQSSVSRISALAVR